MIGQTLRSEPLSIADPIFVPVGTDEVWFMLYRTLRKLKHNQEEKEIAPLLLRRQ